MKKHNLDAAADFANREVSRWISSETGIPQSPGEYLLWWKLGCEYRVGPNATYIVMYDCLRDWLVSAARCNADARKLLSRIASSKLHAGVALTKAESFFAASILDGTAPPLPKKRGKTLSTNHERDVFIFTMMKELIDGFKINASRNDVSSEHASACDLIADAFAAYGRHEVTFRAVKDVWNNKQFRGRYYRLADAVNAELAKQKDIQEAGPQNALAGFPLHLIKL
ncbi:hypothetical protein [Paracoccus siganidrum]|uniref:hypothetical protein n=1 Tax=Paracoccus siganidrum TaxID=1276757 RepID=UPI0011C3C4B1|nr:hypothetical protein [Paracoccus siganidrum]